MDERAAREALVLARVRRDEAAEAARRADVHYGRMYAAALTVLSREDLERAGFPVPTAMPPRNPATKTDPPCPRPWPAAARWLAEGVEGGPDL